MKDKILALDIGGTNVRAAIVNEKLDIIDKLSIKSITNNPNALLNKIINLSKTVSENYLLDLSGIGVSICGIVKNNVIGKCGNLSIDGNFDLFKALKNEFKTNNIKIANDANCSALAESKYGASKNVKDSIFVTLSSGIGTGIVLNKKLIDIPFEGGRQIIEYNHEFYEAEYLLSGNGLVRLSRMNALFIDNAKDFFKLLKKEDSLAKKIYDIWIRRLSLFFSNLQLLFNVDQFVLSGGLMLSRQYFLNDLIKISNASISSWKLKPINITSAHYEQDVGIIGASALVL